MLLTMVTVNTQTKYNRFSYETLNLFNGLTSTMMQELSREFRKLFHTKYNYYRKMVWVLNMILVGYYNIWDHIWYNLVYNNVNLNSIKAISLVLYNVKFSPIRIMILHLKVSLFKIIKRIVKISRTVKLTLVHTTRG